MGKFSALLFSYGSPAPFSLFSPSQIQIQGLISSPYSTCLMLFHSSHPFILLNFPYGYFLPLYFPVHQSSLQLYLINSDIHPGALKLHFFLFCFFGFRIFIFSQFIFYAKILTLSFISLSILNKNLKSVPDISTICISCGSVVSIV